MKIEIQKTELDLINRKKGKLLRDGGDKLSTSYRPWKARDIHKFRGYPAFASAESWNSPTSSHEKSKLSNFTTHDMSIVRTINIDPALMENSLNILDNTKDEATSAPFLGIGIHQAPRKPQEKNPGKKLPITNYFLPLSNTRKIKDREEVLEVDEATKRRFLLPKNQMGNI